MAFVVVEMRRFAQRITGSIDTLPQPVQGEVVRVVMESIHCSPGTAWKWRMLSSSAMTPGE